MPVMSHAAVTELRECKAECVPRDGEQSQLYVDEVDARRPVPALRDDWPSYAWVSDIVKSDWGGPAWAWMEAKGGERVVKGGERPVKGGERVVKGGERVVKGGERVVKGGERVVKGW